MITVHHLGISQSERILWLLEELQIPYNLVHHTRDPVRSPQTLTSLPGNETGTSPFIEDSEAGITLSESLAISDYIIYKYGAGRFALKPSDPNYHEYLHWYHYSNSSLQPAFLTAMFLNFAEPPIPQDSMMMQFANQRVHGALAHMESRLAKHQFLAGDEFTAADMMSVYSVTTQRYFGPQVSLEKYPHLLRWLGDCAGREAYQRAMRKGDPEMKLLLGAEAPSVGMMEAGGSRSGHWKK